MFLFDDKMVEAKKQYLKTQPYVKWTYCDSIPLQNLLDIHHCLSLQHMARKMVVDVFKSKKFSQFQLVYMSYPNLNQNKVFKDQVGKNNFYI